MAIIETRKIDSGRGGIVIITASADSYAHHKTARDPETCGLAHTGRGLRMPALTYWKDAGSE